MTPSEAAAAFLELQPIEDAISSRLKAAKAVLKEHMVGRRSYRKITTSGGGSQRLNAAVLLETIGQAKVEACKRFVPSTSLILPPHLRKGAVRLEATLVPVPPTSPE